MNILYLIGNGFDVSLGMKTRYADFYDAYCAQAEENVNSKVCELKKIIESGKDNWADLEWAFGQYTTRLANYQEFEEVYYNLSDALIDYLRREEKKVDPDRFSKEELLKYLVSPEIALTTADQRLVGRGNPNSMNNIDLVTFNYTRTIERILNWDANTPLRGRVAGTGVPWTFGQVLHVHGTLDEGATILLGVNDPTQIANQVLAKNEEVTDILVKPYSNRVLKQEVDVKCKSFINRADIIVLFGLSVGATDAIWWKEIMGRLSTSSAILIIYHFDTKLAIAPNRGQRLGAIERQVRQNFLRQAGSPVTESSMRERILVGVNSGMFGRVKKSS